MDNNFIDKITQEIIDKINVTSIYQNYFDGIDFKQDSLSVLIKIFEKIFNKTLDIEVLKEAYNKLNGEENTKSEDEFVNEISDDYSGKTGMYEDANFEDKNYFKMVSVLTANIKNLQQDIPEELKLILLTDAFNTIGHNYKVIFNRENGRKFWFGLKSQILLEMVGKFGKENVYVDFSENEAKNDVAIYFKTKINNENEFFSWHLPKEEVNKLKIQKVYSNQNVKHELLDTKVNNGELTAQERDRIINENLPIDTFLKTHNLGIYNHIFCLVFEHNKAFEECFNVDYIKESDISYKGGGNYEKAFVKENVEETKVDLFEKIKESLSKEEIERVIKEEGVVDKVKYDILKTRGRYSKFYVRISYDGKEKLIECEKEFRCEDYKGRCYTKIDLEKIEAEIGENNNEIKAIVKDDNEKIIEENDNQSTVSDKEETQITLKSIEKYLASEDGRKRLFDIVSNMSEKAKVEFMRIIMDTLSQEKQFDFHIEGMKKFRPNSERNKGEER